MVSEMYPGQVPSHRIRVTDDERRRAVERLCRAQAAGCLALDEFDERAAAAWAARTRGDLATLTGDLPPDRAWPPVRELPVHRHPALRRVTSIWLVLSVLSVAGWAMLATVLGVGDPWWIWVLGPPGALLATAWFVVDHR